MKKNGSLLVACGALACGEGLASLFSGCTAVWPVFLIAFVFVALFGYAFAWRITPFLLVFLFGFILFSLSSLSKEHSYRLQPWMRNRVSRTEKAEPLSALRREFSCRLGIGLNHDRDLANLNRAILLGERYRLNAGTKRLFVESGTMHIFAISGLHVMIIAKVIVTMLTLCFVPYRFVGLAAIPFVWCYVALIGFAPSAVRAGLMASVYFLAPLFYRRPDGMRAWILTYFLVHLARPQMIANVGSNLSFAVMLAIVLVGEWDDFLGRNWKMTLAMTLAAWAAGLPIAAHVFGRVTPGGLLANIPLLFAAQFSVSLAFLGLGASYVSLTLASHLNNLSALFTKAMVGVSDAISRLPFANIEMCEWSFALCAEWYLAIALIVYLVRGRKRRLAVC